MLDQMENVKEMQEQQIVEQEIVLMHLPLTIHMINVMHTSRVVSQLVKVVRPLKVHVEAIVAQQVLAKDLLALRVNAKEPIRLQNHHVSPGYVLK
jgi:hypothetical protein